LIVVYQQGIKSNITFRVQKRCIAAISTSVDKKPAAAVILLMAIYTGE
jgi:hypothetical protein